MLYTLIVIDFQAVFSATRDVRVQQNCLKEIKLAIAKKAPILFVEYRNCGPTLNILKKFVKNYDNVFTVLKSDNDGSKEIFSKLKQKNLPLKVRVVGVNTHQCVGDTVISLSSYFKLKVKIVGRACNSPDKKEHFIALNNFKKLPRCKVIYNY